MCGELCCIDNYDEAFVHSYLSEETFKGSCVCGTEFATSKREAELKDEDAETVDFFTCTEYNQWVGNEMFFFDFFHARGVIFSRKDQRLQRVFHHKNTLEYYFYQISASIGEP